MTKPLDKLDLPSSDEFTKTLGKVVWLLGMSKEHRREPISTIEASFIAPLMFKQLRLIFEGKNPVAAVTWAYASPAVRERIDAGEPLDLQDWRSGPELVIVDCVSPFVKRDIVKEKFLAEIDRIRSVQPAKTDE